MYPQYPWQYPLWSSGYPGIAQQDGQIQNVRFVSGIEGAKACATPVGSRVLLMDKESQRFYIRQSDADGVTTITEYEFKEVKPEPPKEYVTRQDLEQFAIDLVSQLKEQKNESVVSPHIDPASIPTINPVVTNVANSAIPQNDYAAASQIPSGAAYTATGYDAAGSR